jgi:RNA polymerase sigma-70 factor (ECF subfamily)
MSAPSIVETEVAGEQLLRVLLDACARGHESALAQLFDRTAPSVLSVARCVAADEQAAQHATHDAYVEIWHRAVAGRLPAGDPAMWILGVVHRHALATVTAGAA